MFNEVHSAQRDMQIRDIIARMRHDGCGGRAGRVELLTGIEGASSVRHDLAERLFPLGWAYRGERILNRNDAGLLCHVLD